MTVLFVFRNMVILSSHSKCHYVTENNIIGIDESDGRLLFIYAEADHEDSIPLTETILQRHPCLSMTSQLEDCHIYCISYSALNSEKCRKFVLRYIFDLTIHAMPRL